MNVAELISALKKISKGNKNKNVYILNHDIDDYQCIDGIRIDGEDDVVIDISS